MFQKELKKVPNKPGSYQMYDNKNHIIYIGKAKDLKKRLSSYFNRETFGKTKKMVSEISYFKYIVTDTELESFILELNLIKKYKPKYNILLRDDKTYPYIEYTKRPFPELKVVRYQKRKKNTNTVLFGPYVNVYAARRVVRLLNRIYPLKKCSTLPKEPCLYYFIDECLGYCFKEVSNEMIEEIEKEILNFFRGNSNSIKNKIKEKMNIHSDNLNYELANELKEELDFIEIILERQKVELSLNTNLDAINYYIKDNLIAIVILFIRDGKLLGSKEDMFVYNGEVESIDSYIGMFYEKNEIPPEVIVPKKVNAELLSKVYLSKFKHIIKGDKDKLLELAKKNAKIYYQASKTAFINKENNTFKANEELSIILNTNIKTIEAFDNSNLFGEHSVSGMVVFTDGKPDKNQYRKFKIKKDTNDDYKMMKEVLYRRYFRLLSEKKELPDLIIVDGGVGHVRAALDIIDSLGLDIKLIGLKKNNKHQTESIIDSSFNEINIKDNKLVYNYLSKIQDEVHRYTINYHQNIRSKSLIHTNLADIKGIGPKRIKLLLKKYGSINNIKNATNKELEEILPKEVARNLKESLKNEK